ncbi:MAG: tetratricopeptide repeat protein [Pyrinomonadaceae bacterium]
MENFKLLFQIYYRPASAMSEILDKGSWLFAAGAVLVVAFAFYKTVNPKLETFYAVPQFYQFYDIERLDSDEFTPKMEAEYEKAQADYRRALSERPKIPIVGDLFFTFFSFGSSFLTPLVSLSVFYVPAVILLMCFLGGVGNFGVVLRRDYGALATCTLLGWAAAHLPFAVLGVLLFTAAGVLPGIYLSFWFLSALLFGVFMIFALRTVFGANYGPAALTVAVGWLAISLGTFVFQFISPWMLSPFLLFYAVIYLGGYVGGEVRGFGNAFRQRQNFKRFLHNATVNPKDADARVQLGLIYLQRRQEEKALRYFTEAFEIDNEEIDANYELGKLARRSGELQEALDYFATVAGLNDKHSLSEVWREIGATYLEAGMLNEARDALKKFIERRPVDPEGLYYLGKVYKARNEPEKAREMFEEAIESARTSPDFRRREQRHWSRLAQKEI